MKNLTSRLVVLTIFALCAVAAFGQSDLKLKGDVPFDFVVGKQILSSGTYTIANMMGRIDVLRDDNGKPTAFVTMPLSYTGDGHPRLVFHRYGNEYVLAEIWSSTAGYGVGISKAQERKLAMSGNYETIAMMLEPVVQ